MVEGDGGVVGNGLGDGGPARHHDRHDAAGLALHHEHDATTRPARAARLPTTSGMVFVTRPMERSTAGPVEVAGAADGAAHVLLVGPASPSPARR